MMVVVAIMAALGHRAIAPALLVMGVVAACRRAIWRDSVALIKQGLARAHFGGIAFIAFFIFCLWVGIASIWSPTSGALKLSTNVMTPVLAGFAACWQVTKLPSDRQRSVAVAFMVMTVIAAILLGVEALSGGIMRDIFPPKDLSHERFKDMTALGRGTTILTFLVFPAMGLMRWYFKNWWAAGGLFLASFSAAVSFTISSNVLALLAALVVFILANIWPRAIAWGTVIGVVTLIICAPLLAFLPSEAIMDLTGERITASWLQRLAVWEAAGAAALDCLPLGCGPDYSRAMMSEWALIDVPGSPVPLRTMPTHPHNLFIQIWLELGVPGGVLTLLGVLCLFVWYLSHGTPISPVVVAGTLAVITAVTVSSLVEFSLWQVWRLCAIGFGILGVSMSHIVSEKRL